MSLRTHYDPDHLAELRAFQDIGEELRLLSSRTKPALNGRARIAYCLHNSLPHQHGGYAMRSHAIAKALRARGHDLIGFGRPGFPTDGIAEPIAPPARANVDGVPYRFENRFGRRGRAHGYLAEAADYYERVFIENEVGVVHAATNFWTALPAGLAAHRLDLPFIYEVRSFWAITREAREAGFRNTPQAWRDEMLETITLALADHVVTLNAAMREHLVHYGIEGAATSLVPNCVDGNVYSPRPRDSALAATYGLGENDVVIGYMGAMLGYEGLDLLVEAVTSMIEAGQRAKLLIVGADSVKRTQPGTIEFDLEKRIAVCGITGSIILADRIAPDSVPAHYGLFDICAYPRRDFEVCNLVSPLKPLEAMACGKAIVASDVGGMRGMIEDGKTGLVHAANDMADLQSRLSTLVTDREMRLRLGQSARSFAVAERSWDEVARSMSDAYASAAAAHAQGMDSARRDRLAAAWRQLSG